ncbi:hypothetical protein CYMTET_9994 [Cymbomonas tetramitiformis]|uniref:AP2/ERF domain-containing protein n=1 Tax=Cymbomonas tetramitiformis TaxID=36881 RepID=A0AAE0GQ60_9CHLO|nr:hypothetical protein CYMTET_9994 [Cymbomonas tetramitiformis]
MSSSRFDPSPASWKNENLSVTWDEKVSISESPCGSRPTASGEATTSLEGRIGVEEEQSCAQEDKGNVVPTANNLRKHVREDGPSLSPRSKLRRAAASFDSKPAICCRPKAAEEDSSSPSEDNSRTGSEECFERSGLDITVACWPADPMHKKIRNKQDRENASEDSQARKAAEQGIRQSVHKVARQKGVSSGRTYTSKYRGVHQTFPTRRWEAQFRRAGKPTSLGCFDREEEAARAYDKMMVWIELHSAEVKREGQLKGGTTNFEINEYIEDIDQLRDITQDELVQALRREGRSQAAQNAAAALREQSHFCVSVKG